jgi:hypothetical protein
VTLPAIESTRAVGVCEVYDATIIEISSVKPTVSHIVRTSNGDLFSNGMTSRRVYGGTSKRFYGVGKTWFESNA